eukprot:131590-Amphidinium_carterae.1
MPPVCAAGPLVRSRNPPSVLSSPTRRLVADRACSTVSSAVVSTSDSHPAARSRLSIIGVG